MGLRSKVNEVDDLPFLEELPISKMSYEYSHSRFAPGKFRQSYERRRNLKELSKRWVRVSSALSCGDVLGIESRSSLYEEDSSLSLNSGTSSFFRRSFFLALRERVHSLSLPWLFRDSIQAMQEHLGFVACAACKAERVHRFSPTTDKRPESMSKRKLEAIKEIARSREGKSEVAPAKKQAVKKRKQKVLVLSTRGITTQYRHLMEDLKKLLPHSKKENKMDAKDDIPVLNEICELKGCNKCVFFEVRKRQDLYIWMSNVPQGPSIKFHCTNGTTRIHISSYNE